MPWWNVAGGIDGDRHFCNQSAHDGARVFSFLSESIDGFERHRFVAHDIEYTDTWASWD